MAEKTTILDMNRFDDSNLDGLDENKRELVRRRRILGKGYRLFYKDPVEIVRGKGSHVFDEKGNDYLDAYNNVVSVGHCHPHVVEAIAKQAATLNTHTRYLHETILDYSEALIAKMPREIDRITYQCTGSEANDLDIRIARNYTSGRGIIITNEAYRGNTEKKPDEPGDPWFNFHAGRNDFKLRYALQGTRYWGSYITDAIKDYQETNSGEVEKTLRKDPKRVDENLKGLREELELLGGKPVLVALGYAAEKNLRRMRSEGHEVVSILHPARYIGKKEYRDRVLEVLDNIRK